MTWFKVDDSFYSHPKVLAAGNAAIGLWLRCGSWCADHLTDGLVPDHIVRMYGTASNTNALLKAGLWTRESDGFLFHDWSDYQPTREQVMAERAAAAERQRRGRNRQKSRRDDDRDTHRESQSSHGVTTPASHGGPVPTRPVVTEVTTTRDPQTAFGQDPDDTPPSDPKLVAELGGFDPAKLAAQGMDWTT